MTEYKCGLCDYEEVAGNNYCSNCGRPLSIEAKQIQARHRKEFEKRLQG